MQTAELNRVFEQQRAVLGMCSSPLRFDWRRGLGESLRATYRRRRNMLQAAGCTMGNQHVEWHELPEKVRLAMIGALA